jgi:glucose repression regulatory protein TUP1
LWDFRTGHLLEKFQGHTKSVYSVAFAPDGLSVVSGSLDRTVRVWDISPATLQALSTPSDDAPEIIVTTSCRHIFAGHSDFVLSVIYPGSTSSLGRVDPTGRTITDPDFDFNWVVSGSKDRNLIFWDAKLDSDPIPLMTLEGHKNSGIMI